VALSNDEIEVACDALWSVKRWAGWDDDQERLWERLRPIRTGDYGGEFEDDETIFAESATPRLEPSSRSKPRMAPRPAVPLVRGICWKSV